MQLGVSLKDVGCRQISLFFIFVDPLANGPLTPQRERHGPLRLENSFFARPRGDRFTIARPVYPPYGHGKY